MAMTFNPVSGPNGPFVNLGDINGRLYDCVCDSSYPNTGNDTTAGYTVTGKIALNTILTALGPGTPKTANALGVQALYRPDTGKVRLFFPSGGASAGANVNTAPVATYTGNMANTNHNSVGNAVALTGGCGVELANNTNCASLTYRFLFVGM